MKTKIGGRIVRYCPFPSYDVEGLQCWLEDQAEKGWFLRKDGFFGFFARLERGTPCKCRYRITALLNRTVEQDRELHQMTVEAGWEWVGNHGDFSIYRTTDPTVIELHTDPQVQALELRKIRRYFLILAGIPLFNRVWTSWPLVKRCGPLTALLERGTLHLCIWFFCELLCILVPQLRLGRQARKLRQGIPLTEASYWKQGARNQTIYRLVVLFLLMGMLNAGFSVIAPEPYDGTLPFGTLEELPALEIQKVEWTDAEIRSDLLAPQILTVRQSGEFTLENGEAARCSYYADYYHAVSYSVARRIFREREEKISGRQGIRLTELREVEVDRCSYGQGGTCVLHLLLRSGKDVLFVQLYFDDQWGLGLEEIPFDPETIAAQLAESMT